MRAALAPEVLIAALPTLRTEGYEVLSFSGGEPLLYTGFETLVRNAVALGFRINLISNGAPVGGRLLDVIAEYVNLIAISLDGAPATHIEIRGNPQAFMWAERAMGRLAERGVRYGIAYCVSRESLADMPWAVEFAASKGASLVQFHPFAAVGRGQKLADRLSLDHADKARAYVIATLLETENSPSIQLDLAPVEAARARRDDYAILKRTDARAARLSDLINPLVIDERGGVLPLSYGIDPRLTVGTLSPHLPAVIEQYKMDGWQDLRAVIDTAFACLDQQGEYFIDWFHHLVETSHTFHPFVARG
jgi:MoaA/NifB/PqqE/SkfB family radical SAM enzyme